MLKQLAVRLHGDEAFFQVSRMASQLIGHGFVITASNAFLEGRTGFNADSCSQVGTGCWVDLCESNLILFCPLEELDFSLLPPPPPKLLCHKWIHSFYYHSESIFEVSFKYYDQFFIRIYIFVQNGLHMWLWLIQRDLECIYTFANVPATLLYYPNFYCKNLFQQFGDG